MLESILALAISVASLGITFYFNLKLSRINEKMYRLAYEQDLLRRKEEHFRELKEEVIKPLLEGKTEDVNEYLLIDLIRYRYLCIGEVMREYVKACIEYEEVSD